MKTRHIALLAAGALAAHAHAMPTTQWKPSAESMFELIQGGFKLVSTMETRFSATAATRTFYLQKDSNVAYCLESWSNNVGKKFECYRLVQPYNESTGSQ